jgi:hypothetical protein
LKLTIFGVAPKTYSYILSITKCGIWKRQLKEYKGERKNQNQPSMLLHI